MSADGTEGLPYGGATQGRCVLSTHSPEKTSTPRVQRKHLWLVLAIALVALGAVYWGIQTWRGPVVPAVLVQAQTLVRTLQFSARVETRSRVGVGSTVVGRVESVLVREGDVVQAGQLLVLLEQAELHAAERQAQASLVQAQAQLLNVRSNNRIGSQAQMAQAQAGLTQAKAEWARTEKLVSQGFLSKATLDEKRKVLDVAQAQLQAAAAQAAASAEGGAELQSAQAQLQQAQAALAVAQAKLAQTRIVAPSQGKVLQRDVEPGQIVQPGTTLLQLALEGPTLIVAQVDERYLDQLREGQHAVVVADAFPAQRLAAQIVSIAPGVDAQRGAVEVKLALDDAAPAFLREDMTLSVVVETGKLEQALVLPLAAVTGTQVLVLEEGKATPRNVQLGMRNLEEAQVQAGLQAGEVVVLPPAKAGQRVRVQEHE